ncbi:hypothetical protein AB0I28_11120 [Phytomonospora sp. NPDC050363]|uniref:hypothetical protein n=1 Tax=Phytomonospora sp. NPDC050363 TaxID=3155642 RepID=UPI0033DC89CE
MPVLDLIDDTYMACSPETLAPLVSRPGLAAELWPEWRVSVTEERGVEGVRWEVGGPVVGSTEVWIERYRDRGSLVHVYVRVDPVGRPWSARAAERHRERTRRRVKAVMWELKDRVERDS